MSGIGGSEFIEWFHTLHETAKRRPLAPGERAEYDEGKERFATALCAAQRISLRPGQPARTAFLTAVLLKAEIALAEVVLKTVTMDVSMTGFSALVAVPTVVGTEARFKIALPKSEPITGRAVVTAIQRTSSASSHRVTFAFVEMSLADATRLEAALFDAVLHRLTPRA